MSEYQTQGFVVKNVEINAPLKGIFGSVKHSLENILESSMAKNQNNKSFQISEMNKGRDDLRDLIKNQVVLTPQSRLSVRIPSATIRNCNLTDKTLTIVYQFYIFQPGSYYFTRVFELNKNDKLKDEIPNLEANNKIKRETPKTPETTFFNNVKIQPYLGYDETRKIYGGTKVNFRLANPILQNLELEALGSTTSQEIKATLSGQKDFETSLIRHFEWRLNYKHSETPTIDAKLKQGTVSAQFYSATRAFTANNIIFRFGGLIEGGNRQTEKITKNLPTSIIANGKTTSGKWFVGMSMSSGKHFFKSSFGFQASNTEDVKKIDFTKIIFDSSANLNFQLTDEKTLSTEIQFTAGHLRTFSTVPISERFFGGSAERNFLDGDAWFIQTNPLIRSFSPNHLSSGTNDNSFGGDSFYSLNFTSSFPLWRKSLVPKSAWEDPHHPGELKPDLKAALDLQFEAAKLGLWNSHLSDSKSGKDFIQNSSRKLSEIKETMENKLQSIPDNEDAISGIKDNLKEIEEGIKRLQGGEINIIIGLVLETPVDDELISSSLDDLVEKLAELENNLQSPQASMVQTLKTDLLNLKESIKADYEQLIKSEAGKNSTKKAEADVKYPQNILNYFLKEADLFSVNPVFIFDLVQLKQNGAVLNPIRYGIGGGIKLRFVGLDVTSGYVFNTNRKLNEQRGAFFFKFGILDFLK